MNMQAMSAKRNPCNIFIRKNADEIILTLSELNTKMIGWSLDPIELSHWMLQLSLHIVSIVNKWQL